MLPLFGKARVIHDPRLDPSVPFHPAPEMGRRLAQGSDERFAAYVEEITSVIGHADWVGPVEAYCIGLLLPSERKSVEPMVAVTAPKRDSAQHQSLLHVISHGGWSDGKVLGKVREMVQARRIPRLNSEASRSRRNAVVRHLNWITHVNHPRHTKTQQRLEVRADA